MQANDAWSAVAELAASQHGAFHARQAAELGISRRSLRTAVAKGLMDRASPNVFVSASSPTTWKQSLMAQTLIGGIASHQAAAQLHGLDGFTRYKLELTVERGQRPRGSQVRLHQYNKPIGQDHVTIVDSIPCTDVAVTLVHLAVSSPAFKVEQALDSALRMGHSNGWIRDTLSEMWRPGPTGLGPLSRILDDPSRAGQLPDSWFERRIAKALASNGLGRPKLQFAVRAGNRTRRFDLAYPEVKLAIEGHSRRFHWGHQAEEADNIRDLEVSQLGWEIIYVSWAMLESPAKLASTVSKIYRTRQKQLGAA